MEDTTAAERLAPRALGIVRTTDSLQRIVWRMVDTEWPDKDASLSDLSGCCALERAPLGMPMTAREKLLRDSWDSLSRMRSWNAETLAALLIVLIETVFEDAERPLGSLPFANAMRTRAIRPTAAHPRAYQGTTRRPPKDKAPSSIDLRPYLGDRLAVRELLSHLAPFRDEAVALLSRRGCACPTRTSPDCDPYAAWNHGCAQDIMMPYLASHFRTGLLPALRGRPWNEVERLHTLFLRLRLEDNRDLMACAAGFLLDEASRTHLADWCDLLLHLPDDQRAGLARLLLHTGATTMAPRSLPSDFRDVVREVACGPDAAYRMYRLLDGVAMEVDVQYLLSGFRLHDQIYGDGKRRIETVIGRGGYFPAEAARRILAHITADDAFERWRVVHLWEACSKLDGFGGFLESRDWTQWPPAVTRPLLEAYYVPMFEDTDGDTARKWHLARSHTDLIETTLRGIAPEYRWKFCDSLREFVACAKSDEMTQDSIPNACAFLTRICRHPFHPRRNNAFVWVDFLSYLSPEQCDVLLNAPDASFARLEKACAIRNNERHIGWGTWALAKADPALTLAGFLQAPTRFFRTAKTLGCLSPGERLQIVRRFMQEPAMLMDTDLLDDGDAYAFIRKQGDFIHTTVIPRALQSHYEGGTSLNAPRLAYYHGEMRRQWTWARLERLDDLILRRLTDGYPLEERGETARHTVLLARGARENRRALRKFLTSYWSGRQDYIREHPLTKQWLKAHPKPDIGLWTGGIPYTARTTSGRDVTITLERDPLEAFKLGTYVGSCLGLGGILEYSAAATMLDINKQVLYARSASGTVIGRQIVAITDAGELACFSVYPFDAENELHPLFAEYDRRFAAALGLPLFTAGEDAQGDEYTISCIVSHGWWDDGVWDCAELVSTRGSARYRTSRASSCRRPSG